MDGISDLDSVGGGIAPQCLDFRQRVLRLKRNRMTNSSESDRSNEPSFGERLDDLRGELSRLADLLTEQAAAKKRRRRLTIRAMMFVCMAFGVLFAAYGNRYRSAQDQVRQADALAGQAAFVMYEPRKSLLVSLLPGDSQNPPPFMTKWLGNDFFHEITNVSTNVNSPVQRDTAKVIDAAVQIPSLKRLRLTGITCSTIDLDSLVRLPKLESLDLTRTVLDYGSMPWLARSNLRWFSAAHTRFSDAAMTDLCKIRELQYINLERTAVSDKTVFALTGLPSLRYVNLKRTPVTRATVQRLSKEIPNCVIDWEQLVLGSPNSPEVRAAQRRRLRLGNQMPADPRPTHRAVAPVDKQNQAWSRYQNINYYNPGVRSRSGYVLDVF